MEIRGSHPTNKSIGFACQANELNCMAPPLQITFCDWNEIEMKQWTFKSSKFIEQFKTLTIDFNHLKFHIFSLFHFMFLIFQNIFFFHFESSKICTRVEKTMLNGCWITARQRWRYMKKHVCFSWLHVVHGQHVMIVCISRLEWFCARDQDQFQNSRESYKGFFALAFAFALFGFSVAWTNMF